MAVIRAWPAGGEWPAIFRAGLAAGTARGRLAHLPLLFGGFLGLLALSVALRVPQLGSDGLLLDFDVFYIAGRMAQEGRAAEAYDLARMQAAQRAVAPEAGFMPWTYPPPFGLVAALLPALPRGLAYLLFMGVTLGAWLGVLRRLAGAQAGAVLTAMLPAATIALLAGQSSFLTGALAGLFAWGFLGNRAMMTGVALGLLLVKPHLALGLGLLLLVSGRWRALAAALVTVAVLATLSTWAFGPPIWPAFLDGAREAGRLLGEGHYPLHRMVSAYAGLRGLGLSAGTAMAAQALVALLAGAAVLAVWRRSRDPRRALGVALLATLAASPYVYDYDMTILGLGLAVLAPELFGRGRAATALPVLAACWLLGGAWSHGMPWSGTLAGLTPALPASFLLVAAVWIEFRRTPPPEKKVAA